MMGRESRIFIAGASGLAGSALSRALAARGYPNLLTPSRAELDLTDPLAVSAFFEEQRPEFVFLAAGRCGGIGANLREPAALLHANVVIQTNVLHAAWEAGVRKLMYLACSCVYPRNAPRPIPESALLTGPFEPANEAYSIAKLAGIGMCRAYRAQYGADFIAVIPATLYGPNDNMDPEDSHFLAGLLVRIHTAKESGAASARLWGTGSPVRDLLHADDFADAALLLMERYDGAGPINMGDGQGVTIRETANIVQRVTGYEGAVTWDATRPDGTPHKVLDASRIGQLGWRARISLEDGVRDYYEWFLSTRAVAVE